MLKVLRPWRKDYRRHPRSIGIWGLYWGGDELPESSKRQRQLIEAIIHLNRRWPKASGTFLPPRTRHGTLCMFAKNLAVCIFATTRSWLISSSLFRRLCLVEIRDFLEVVIWIRNQIELCPWAQLRTHPVQVTSQVVHLTVKQHLETPAAQRER